LGLVGIEGSVFLPVWFMLSNELFNGISEKKTPKMEASFRAYQCDLADKYVNNLPVATNTHDTNETVYRVLLYHSLKNTYTETVMEELMDQ
jgi:hypothetical protein